MNECKNCGTCVKNDGGTCDRKGTDVKDEDKCDKWKGNWKEQLLRVFMAGH